MFTESMPTTAAPPATRRSTAAIPTNGWDGSPYSSVSQWRSQPVWNSTAAPGDVDIDGQRRLLTDGGVDQEARHVDDPLQVEPGEVVTVGEAVERRVEVRPRVGHHLDVPDLELVAGRVPRSRVLA